MKKNQEELVFKVLKRKGREITLQIRKETKRR
jgi:hypothetical protein